MPGAWEMPRPNVLVATLTTETVSMKWAVSYRNLQLPPNSAPSLLSGMTYDMARNTAAENALKSGFEWLFFLDSDVCAPPDTIQRLIGHGKDICGGVYWRRSPPIVPCMLRYKSATEAEWITGWNPPGALIEVDLLGTGCMLIHRNALEKMHPVPLPNRPRPWFVWELDKDLAEPRHSEDFSFTRDARRLHGIQTFVDTSVVCEHIGYGASGAAGYQPASI